MDFWYIGGAAISAPGTKTKEIGEIQISNGEEMHIEWIITNYLSHFKYPNFDVHKSSSFIFGEAVWTLQLIHLGNMCAVNFIVGKEVQGPVNFSLRVRKKYCTEELIAEGIYTIADSSFTTTKIPLRRELPNSDNFSILCTLKREIKLSPQQVLTKQKLELLETLSNNLRDLFADKESCDTILLVKDKEIKAHKTILMARSSVFAAMFRHDTLEKKSNIITIPDCDPETFPVFLEFMYRGILPENLSFESAVHLFEISDKYDVQELKKFCKDKYLWKNLHIIENFCTVASVADKHNDPHITVFSQFFFDNHKDEILETAGWKDLLENNFQLADKLMKGSMPKTPDVSKLSIES